MNAYTVEKYCEVGKVWACVYRNGKGDLFSSLKGAKAYVTRNVKRIHWSGRQTPPSYRINTYTLELDSTETI
jgi:hypothetical protein